MNTGILTLGFASGFVLAQILSGEKEGEQGLLKSFKFDLKQYIVHLHHWIIAMTGLVVLMLLGIYSDLTYGVLIGLVVQGVAYRDFYRIIYRRAPKE